jgi:hypothetical protein
MAAAIPAAAFVFHIGFPLGTPSSSSAFSSQLVRFLSCFSGQLLFPPISLLYGFSSIPAPTDLSDKKAGADPQIAG